MRATIRISMRRLPLALALASIGAAPLAAQLPNASTAAFAMGGNFTAMARGFEAVAWNPANLAMPGRPFISFGAAIAGGNMGLAPIDFTTLHKFSGKVVDSATRASWIDKAKLAGGQRANIDGGLTPIAFTLGPVGFQYGGSVYTNVNLSPDAWESWLFGNAGNNGGQPKTLDFTGTSVRIGAFSAAALSYAHGIPINLTNGILPDEHAAIGVTAKYVMGHALVIAEDNGSTFGGSDILLRFPVILPDSNYNGTLGNGTGVDLSLAWSGGPWKMGVLAENVFNAFKWDTTVLAFAPGTGGFVQNSSSTNFDQQPYATAPKALRDIVAAQAFKPAVSVGAALKVTGSLTLTADMKTTLGGEEAIVVGPKSRFGIGAEWRLLPFIPLRAGVASVTDGWQAGAGVGVHLLGFEVGVASSIRRIGAAQQSGVMIGLVGIGR
jgi:hypothetical protein